MAGRPKWEGEGDGGRADNGRLGIIIRNFKGSRRSCNTIIKKKKKKM